MKLAESEWASLMRAANGGDSAAYAKLLQKLTPLLRSAARHGLRRAGASEADAEDVVQETLLAMHLKRHTWTDTAPFGPWLHAIARHKLIDFLRRGGRRSYVSIDDVTDFLGIEAAEPQNVSSDIERHLPGLPARQREVVRAIAVDGQSIGETAKRFGMAEGAVRVALHRGLNNLSAKLT